MQLQPKQGYKENLNLGAWGGFYGNGHLKYA